MKNKNKHAWSSLLTMFCYSFISTYYLTYFEFGFKFPLGFNFADDTQILIPAKIYPIKITLTDQELSQR